MFEYIKNLFSQMSQKDIPEFTTINSQSNGSGYGLLRQLNSSSLQSSWNKVFANNNAAKTAPKPELTALEKSSSKFNLGTGTMSALNGASSILGKLGAGMNTSLNPEVLTTRETLRSGISKLGPVGSIIGATTAAVDLIGDATGIGLDSLDKNAANRAGLSIQSTSNNILGAIPGLGTVGGLFAGNTKTANKSKEIDNLSGAYGGTYGDINAAVELGGKRTLFGKRKANNFINTQNRRNELLTDIALENNERKLSTYSGGLASQNYNKFLGNSGSNMIIGQNGMKFPELEEARGILNKKLSYEQWKNKHKLSETNNYDLKTAYDLGYIPDENGHLPTVNKNTGEFLKKSNHPTIQLEFEWFNSDDPEAVKYRKTHKLIKNSNGNYQYVPINNTPIFAEGGKMNIVVEGALHSQNNHLDKVNEDLSDVTKKGVPVVYLEESGEMIQTAEVEGGELILTKAITDQIEEFFKDGSEEAMIKAGKLLAKELITNTDDKTEKLLNDGIED